MKKIAEIVSLILNPAFLILCLILLGIEKSNFSQTGLITWTLVALTLNGLFPFLALVYLTKKEIVLDDILENKEVLKNRPTILAFGTLILLVELIATNVIYSLDKPQLFLAILTTLFLLILALFLVSLYKKISLHVALVTAFTLIVLILFGFSFWPILFLIPIISWSRAILLRHTARQMAAAFALTLLITGLVFYSFRLLSF